MNRGWSGLARVRDSWWGSWVAAPLIGLLAGFGLMAVLPGFGGGGAGKGGDRYRADVEDSSAIARTDLDPNSDPTDPRRPGSGFPRRDPALTRAALIPGAGHHQDPESESDSDLADLLVPPLEGAADSDAIPVPVPVPMADPGIPVGDSPSRSIAAPAAGAGGSRSDDPLADPTAVPVASPDRFESPVAAIRIGLGIPEGIDPRSTSETAPAPAPDAAEVDDSADSDSDSDPDSGSEGRLLPVEAFVEWALAENRSIRAAWMEIQALRERIPQVAVLDDPMVLNEVMPSSRNGMQTVDGFMPYVLRITQRVPAIGTLAWRVARADRETRAAVHRWVEVRLDVVNRVRAAYEELAYAQRALAVYDANLVVARDVARFVQARYETGQSPQRDLIRARRRLDEVERERVDAVRLRDEARAALARWIRAGGPGVDTDPAATAFRAETDRPLPDVPAEVGSLLELAARANPKVAALRAELERDEADIPLARLKGVPDLEIGFLYQTMTRSGAMYPFAEGNDSFGFMIGFNVPHRRARINAGVREAEARAAATRLRSEDAEDEAREQARLAYVRARSAQTLLEIARDRLKPKSRADLRAAANAYRVGDAPLDELLSVSQDLLTLELTLARAEADLRKSLADLERAVGADLAREVVVNGATPAPATGPGPAPESLPAPDAARAPVDNPDSNPNPATARTRTRTRNRAAAFAPVPAGGALSRSVLVPRDRSSVEDLDAETPIADVPPAESTPAPTPTPALVESLPELGSRDVVAPPPLSVIPPRRGELSPRR